MNTMLPKNLFKGSSFIFSRDWEWLKQNWWTCRRKTILGVGLLAVVAITQSPARCQCRRPRDRSHSPPGFLVSWKTPTWCILCQYQRCVCVFFVSISGVPPVNKRGVLCVNQVGDRGGAQRLAGGELRLAEGAARHCRLGPWNGSSCKKLCENIWADDTL